MVRCLSYLGPQAQYETPQHVRLEPRPGCPPGPQAASFHARPNSLSLLRAWRPSLRRHVQCCVFALELQRVVATARLNSMHGPLPKHAEDVGQAIDTVLPPGIQLMQQKLSLAGRSLTLIVPRCIDAVLDMYIEQDQGDRDPYWARPWPAALALAQLILQQPQLVKGRRVCDFGCGLGLAGIAAALSGAREVVMLDREPLALQCALLSAQACGISSVQDYTQHQRPAAAATQQQVAPQSAPGTRVSAAESTAGKDDKQQSMHQVRGEVFDWSRPSPSEPYDLALACDVLYEAFSVEPVAKAIPQLLNLRTGRLLLADPSRRTKENRDRFVGLLGRPSPAPLMLQERSEVTITMDQLDTQVELQVFRMQQGHETVGIKPFQATTK